MSMMHLTQDDTWTDGIPDPGLLTVSHHHQVKFRVKQAEQGEGILCHFEG